MNRFFFFILMSGIWILASGLSFAILDTNNNGISDLFERKFNNGSLFDESFEPQGDDDKDGWNNMEEAAAGTDPYDANPPDGLIRPTTTHVPAVIVEENGIPVVGTPAHIRVSWPTLVGKQYTMLYSPDLTEGSWIQVDEPFIPSGDDPPYNFQINETDKCFWRVAVNDVDSDGDGLNDYEESQIGTDPWSWDSDGDWLSDGDEIVTYLSNPLDRDTDGDWMPDGWEVTYLLDPADASDGMQDSDEDTLPDQIEYLFMDQGYDPFTANDATLFPWNEDPDNDGLTTAQEFSLDPPAMMGGFPNQPLQTQSTGTNPRRVDTDGDGLPDGWEHENSLDPNDPSGGNGTNGDPDEDGLSNFDEWLNGTNPNSPDSDGDGTNDNDEVNQGSDPNSSDDNGIAPPADEMLDVQFKVGDPSGSHSEKWKMMIRGLDPADDRNFNLASPDFGEPESKVFKLRKGNRYEVSVSHFDTDPKHLEDYGGPDYDWEAIVDGKPTTTSVENINGIPGVNNYFTVKDHWIVDNRQAVFTTEKHGDDQDIVTGHTATLIPAPIERDEDAVDNNWQKIAGNLAKALPGQKINLKIDQSRLPSSLVLSNFQWNLPPLVFKNFEANQQTGTLTEIGAGDINQPDVHFYFTNAGTKPIKLSATINGESIEFNVSLNILEPVANFTTTLGEVRFQTDVLYFNLGLHSNNNSPLGGLGMYGSVSIPAGEPQGVWHWVQMGTIQRSKTNSVGEEFQFTMNGIKALDTSYGYSADFATDGNQQSTSDSPALVCQGWQAFNATDQFELYQMFRPHGDESRFVPLKFVTWGWNGTATKSSSGTWSFSTASPAYCDEVNETTIHPEWDQNLNQGVQPGP